jgi:hypothetical protein
MKKVHRPAIMGSVGRTLASAVEDQELMFDEHRFATMKWAPRGIASRSMVTIK